MGAEVQVTNYLSEIITLLVSVSMAYGVIRTKLGVLETQITAEKAVTRELTDRLDKRTRVLEMSLEGMKVSVVNIERSIGRMEGKLDRMLDKGIG